MISYYKLLCIINNDASFSAQIGFQDPATPIVEGMHQFHSYLLFFSIVIGLFVCFLLYVAISSFIFSVHPTPQTFTHYNLLEIIWTLIPAVILLFIAIPSFSLLYSIEDIINPSITLKVVGHQWYWSYEYSDFTEISEVSNVNFDSYMIPTEDLEYGSFRLLEVDNRVILPVNTHIRLLVTSADVLHSWAVPSFGIKVDACPGRLSEVLVYIKREGVFYGQCSEICGVNHGFMPIVVRSVSAKTFMRWIIAKLS